MSTTISVLKGLLLYSKQATILIHYIGNYSFRLNVTTALIPVKQAGKDCCHFPKEEMENRTYSIISYIPTTR